MRPEIVILGVNHRTGSVDVRERLTFDHGVIDMALRQLVQLPAIDEGVILSTCNRVELVAATGDDETALQQLNDFLATREGVAREQLAEHLFVLRGREAIRHIFRVAASLDSMVVGEPQILGQVKESYERAAAAGSAGTVLHRCFHKSFSVAKRVRTQTGVASKAVSVSSVAVELTSKIFDHLDDKTAMLIGAGTMSELAARHLLSEGVRSIIVTNRTFDRAVELARDFRGTPVPFLEFPRYLQMADVVIGSTAAEGYLLTPGLIRDVLRQRNHRPMFLIDLSVPRNFDPAINELDNVYLYDIDDLSDVAEGNRDERSREALKAEVIVDREVESFTRWLRNLDAVPTIVALREKVEGIRQTEVAKTIASLRELGTREREAIDAMSIALVKKILHTPIQHLKEHDRREAAFYLAAARELFDIEEPEEP
jgi:glutamyl-tRNA reductase